LSEETDTLERLSLSDNVSKATNSWSFNVSKSRLSPACLFMIWSARTFARLGGLP
jgi:hypothetical protein